MRMVCEQALAQAVWRGANYVKDLKFRQNEGVEATASGSPTNHTGSTND